MGLFINLGNARFKRARAGKYVDKTMLIAKVNETLGTEANMHCVARCRRFGKTMAAVMLRAYYDKSCDSRELFRGTAIENHPSFEKHLNKYPVIYVQMTDFITKYGHTRHILEKVQKDIIEDLQKEYPEIGDEKDDDLMDYILRITAKTHEPFFMIIDDWDALCREFDEPSITDAYINLLRRLFNGANTESAFIGAYITGILPIKKSSTESSLNNFREYTMIVPETDHSVSNSWESYFGFTTQEVQDLCEKYGMDFDKMMEWYGSYKIGRSHVYNPHSVMCAIDNGYYNHYWGETLATDIITNYLKKFFDDDDDDLKNIFSNEKNYEVDFSHFKNDLRSIKSKDEVITALIHLGYFSYDFYDIENGKGCCIPTKEVRDIFKSITKENEDWSDWYKALRKWDGNEPEEEFPVDTKSKNWFKLLFSGLKRERELLPAKPDKARSTVIQLKKV